MSKEKIKHTSGPWGVGKRLPYIVACTRPGNHSRNEDYVSAGEETGGNGWPHSRERCEADARLISAAPEMYEALVLVRAFFKSLPEGWVGNVPCDFGLLNQYFLKENLAIRKAEGKL